MFLASSIEIELTERLRLELYSRMPSACTSRSASRNDVRLTPSCSHRSFSIRRWPGTRTPVSIALRSAAMILVLRGAEGCRKGPRRAPRAGLGNCSLRLASRDAPAANAGRPALRFPVLIAPLAIQSTSPLSSVAAALRFWRLNRADWSFRLQIPMAPRISRFAILSPVAGNGGVGKAIPFFRPVAQLIAVPGSLRHDPRQPELLPDVVGAHHVLLRRQRQRRHVVLERGVDQKRSLHRAAPGLGPVSA